MRVVILNWMRTRRDKHQAHFFEIKIKWEPVVPIFHYKKNLENRMNSFRDTRLAN